jgi:biotin synthase
MNINTIFSNIDENKLITLPEIIFLLNTQGQELDELYKKADKIRKENVGDEIFLRGIIEFSNYCKKDCNYCGIRKSNKNIFRYRLPDEEILDVCRSAEKANITTVVLQSGEDPYYDKEKLANLITKIKSETNLAITFSVGEHSLETYKYWKEKGLDRYLIRFETSDKKLFKKCHPDNNFLERISCIKNLQKMKVQIGSGLLIGLPGETINQLAKDIIFCTDLNLDMIGCGPFIANEETPFAKTTNPFESEIYFKTIAILRILNKKAHIPSTTAFDAIDSNARNRLLQLGANVFMPNLTPIKYRKHYLLYPGKPCLNETGEQCTRCVKTRVKNIGRKIGIGPGHSLK